MLDIYVHCPVGLLIVCILKSCALEDLEIGKGLIMNNDGSYIVGDYIVTVGGTAGIFRG